jgi:cytochrome c oxidase cbb3-type subunit 3
MKLYPLIYPWRKSLLLTSSLLAAVLAYGQVAEPPRRAQTRPSVGTQGPLPVHESFSPDSIENGRSSFQQRCAFCHGKDAGGGESGPDLTRSKLVSSDSKGEKVGPVIRGGRLEKGMPPFNIADSEITNLVAFIHSQQDKAMSQTGVRKGVEDSDLLTGNAEAGKAFFNGPGTCSTCHSPTGDLAGVATRYQGLKLEQQMLSPKNSKAKATVTTQSGTVLSGTLAYHDEFTIALVDSNQVYHSWPTVAVKYKIDDPVQAHIQLLEKYTDANIHDLYAYIESLK